MISSEPIISPEKDLAPPSIDELRRILPEFCHKNSIVRLEVFGSVATGTAKSDSDVDLVVTFAPGATPGFRFVALVEELEGLLRAKVDLITSTGLALAQNPILRDSILRTTRLIYAE